MSTTPLTINWPNKEDWTGVKSSDPFLIQCYDLYQSLLGTSFIGVYKGNWPITLGGSTVCNYAVIAFRFDPHNISSTLSAMITQDPSQKIWKAVTGPSEMDPHSDYRLWVKCPINGAMLSQRQTFTIVGISCLSDTVRLSNREYRSGIELTVEAGQLITDT